MLATGWHVLQRLWHNHVTQASAASAAESSQADESTRNKRGQHVVLTFSGQVRVATIDLQNDILLTRFSLEIELSLYCYFE